MKNTVSVKTALMVILTLTVPLFAKYSGGTGDINSPYLIATPEDLNDIANHIEDYNKIFLQTADINMADYDSNTYRIIGYEFDTPFTGIFDGNNYIISNFKWHSDNRDIIGLFGIIDSPSIIKNVNIINTDVNSVSESANTEIWTGGLVGYARLGTTIENCVVSGNVSGGIGVGLIAGSSDGDVINCRADGNAFGLNSVGVLLGGTGGNVLNSNSSGLVICSSWGGGLIGNSLVYQRIENSFSDADVHDGNSAGGLVGYNNEGKIINCYAHGTVTGDANIGGLIGGNFNAVLEKSYSTGLVTGNLNTGGLIGYSELSEVDSCVWDINTSSQQTSAGGTGLTTVQMQIQSTFTEAGWDFIGETVNGSNDIWSICEGTNYPKFSRQKKLGDIICPDGINLVDYSFMSNFWQFSDCYDLAEIDIFADSIINEIDYAILANYWLQPCESCSGADLNNDGNVNASDLLILSKYWLTASDTGCRKADITADRVIDIYDFEFIAENWLEGF